MAFLWFGKKKKIQSTEGSRSVADILIASQNLRSEPAEIGNNFRTYSSQVSACYDMYNNNCKFGGEILRSVVDTRSIFIAGEGISLFSKNEKIIKFVDKLLEYNNMNSFGLIDSVLMGELEGKVLYTFEPSDKDQSIRVKRVSWRLNPYQINTEDDQYTIKSCQLSMKDSVGKIDLAPEQFIYLKLGGTPDKINDTTTKVGCVLTQIENYSRALYDLRKNNHLFGRVTPFFQTTDQITAKAINEAIAKKQWEPGMGYAGSAVFSYVTPQTGAADIITKECSINLKLISSITGVPVHWLGWTDLMSNRATAQELIDFISSSTRKERMIWKKGIKELILKCMIIAVDKGYEDAVYDDDFDIDIPYISEAQIQSLVQVWLPLQQGDVISMQTFRNMLPNVDPQKEEEYINAEKNTNMDRFKSNLRTEIKDTDDKQNQDDEEDIFE